MHPALSIIVFTTLSGGGYGLAAVLGLGLLPATLSVALPGYLLALVMIVGGLMSSTAHLGHPERAWRALSQWRSSWLSREGVLALVTFVPIGGSALGAVFFGEVWPIIGGVAAVLCAATVFSTSMIYASLRTVAQWHRPLTSAVFLGFAASGGLVAAAALAAAVGVGEGGIYYSATLALAGAWLLKAAWWSQASGTASTSTLATATGLGALGDLHQLEAPHANDNYLTREMGFRIARKHAFKLRRIAIVVGGLAPAVLLIAAALLPGLLAAVLAGAALIVHLAGVLVERWLFFAEARHTVGLYYGAPSA